MELFNSDELYTLKEVSERLKITVKGLRKWVDTGLIETFKVGHSVRVAGAELNRFIEESNRKVS